MTYEDERLAQALRSLAEHAPAPSAPSAQDVRTIARRRSFHRRAVLGSLVGAALVAGATFLAINASGPSRVHQITVAGSSSLTTVGATATQTVPTSTEVAVPNVVGESAATAKSSLSQRGFTVSTTSGSSTVVPPGEVIAQSPPAGSMVEPATEVKLSISSGPPTSSG